MTRRPRRTATKFLTYFQLLDAFKEPGCPVCSLLMRGAQKALDSLMYEQVNDPITRERLVESHGFCNWHAWLLPRIANSASGVGVIYRHLLQVALDALEAARRHVGTVQPEDGGWGRWLASRGEPSPLLVWRQKRTPCFLCTLSRQSEHDTLRAMLDYIGEAEFAEACGRSAGLCLPHLELAADLGRQHPNLRALLDIHVTQWRDLHWELGEFGRKADYRYVDEAKGREGMSWSRALELFAGQQGLFGPDRRRRGNAGSAEAEEVAPEQSEAVAQESQDSAESIETRRFENARLKRRVAELETQCEADRKVHIALEFRIHKLAADLKAMAAGVDGVGVAETPPQVPAVVGGTADHRPHPGGDNNQ